MTVWDWPVAHAVWRNIEPRHWARELKLLQAVHAETVCESEGACVLIGARQLHEWMVDQCAGRHATRALRRCVEAGALRMVHPPTGSRPGAYALEWRLERWSAELVPWCVSRETALLMADAAFAARARASVTVIDARLGARSGARHRAFAAREDARKTPETGEVTRAPRRAANQPLDHAVDGFLEEEEAESCRTDPAAAPAGRSGVLEGAAARFVALLNTTRAKWSFDAIAIAGRYADELNAMVLDEDVESLVALMAMSSGLTYQKLMTITRSHYQGGKPKPSAPRRPLEQPVAPPVELLPPAAQAEVVAAARAALRTRSTTTTTQEAASA